MDDKKRIKQLEGDLEMSNEAIRLVRGWLETVGISAAFFDDCGALAVKRITEQGDRVKVLEDMLVENYKTFCHYGRLHAAKNTDEGSKKAHVNLDIAEKIRKILPKQALKT